MSKFILFFIFFIFFILSCNNNTKNQKEEPKSAKIVFVGDIMTHPNIIKSFEKRDVLIDLKDYLKGDLVFANLEFAVNTNKPPMPYPEFNGSLEYLRYFFNYFNLFSVANNHAYDQGAKAEAQTIAEILRNGKLIIGGSTNNNIKDIKPLITNINDIPIFISSYTMLDNGLSYKSNENGYFYFMNFYPKEEDLIEKLKSDLISATNGELKIISLHFGLEYTIEPEEETIKIARNLIENGADIIIGHHPHVPRPAEIYEGENHSGIIVYSLGNFIANHKGRYPYLDIGTILSIEIKENKEIDISFVPTYYAFFTNNFFTNDFFTNEQKEIDFLMKPLKVNIIKENSIKENLKENSINENSKENLKENIINENLMKENPNIFIPDLETNYIYSDYDTNAIINGYKLINEFYGSLTNEKVKNMFSEKS